jgi:transcriptional regulator GlxA family with amidase domain
MIQRKLQKAQILLSNTNLKIKTISVQTGFDDEMYFSKLFRQKVGVSPRQYRKFHHNELGQH